MAKNAERKVFDMVEKGQISADEGLRLLKAMEGGKETKADAVGLHTLDIKPVQAESIPIGKKDIPKIPEEELKRMARLKRWWVLPFGVGLLITILGAIWMYMGYTANGFGFGFWLSWIPFLLGIFILALSFQSRYSVWLHVRIKQNLGKRLSVSLSVYLYRSL